MLTSKEVSGIKNKVSVFCSESEYKANKVPVQNGIKYQCDECDYQANYKSGLTFHLKTVHQRIKLETEKVMTGSNNQTEIFENSTRIIFINEFSEPIQEPEDTIFVQKIELGKSERKPPFKNPGWGGTMSCRAKKMWHCQKNENTCPARRFFWICKNACKIRYKPCCQESGFTKIVVQYKGKHNCQRLTVKAVNSLEDLKHNLIALDFKENIFIVDSLPIADEGNSIYLMYIDKDEGLRHTTFGNRFNSQT